MTDQAPLGVAVVGTGFGQKVHIPGFQHHPQTELVAVYHRDRSQAQVIAEQYDIPYAADNLDAILARPDVAAVSIATPPFLHYDMAKAVLNAGKHLLLEKPMALKAWEVRELYHLAKRQGVRVIADFEFRFVPAWQLLAQYLVQGYVGQPRLIKADWLVVSRADPQRPWNWYSLAAQGGGALGAIGSHAYDYLLWLFGPAQSLCAHLSTAIPNRPDPQAGGAMKPVDADDTGLVMLTLADGTPMQLSFSSVTYQGRGHWLEVYGDRGTLVLGSSNLKDYVYGFKLWGAPAGETLKEIEIPSHMSFEASFADGRLSAFVRVIDHWLGNIQTGQDQAPSLKEGVYSQLLMDLTHQSHQERAWVTVPDLDVFLRGI